MTDVKEIVDYPQLIKNVLALKSEVIAELSRHNLGMNTSDVLEKLNQCLFESYPKKK